MELLIDGDWDASLYSDEADRLAAWGLIYWDYYFGAWMVYEDVDLWEIDDVLGFMLRWSPYY